MRSRIIAIEGIDASGKSTQTHLLADHLRADGVTVEVRSFPRYESFFGRQIRALLDGAGDPGDITADTLDPRSMALWFAMDRWQSFTLSSQCDVLLLNRYTLSNAVYQAARADAERGRSEGDELFAWILELEHTVLGLPHPQLTVVLDLDASISGARSTARARERGASPDVYERSEQLLLASRDRYRTAGAFVDNLALVAVGSRPPHVVAEDVRALLS